MPEEEIIVTEDTKPVEEDAIDLEIVEPTDDVVALKAELEKAKELANNYKIRSEKAEKKAKEAPTATKADSNLSTNDMYALMSAKVAQEDINEVSDYAKLKGISIAEALKAPIVKSILKDKEDERNVSLATNTGGARRSNSKVSDEVLASRLDKGEIPDNEEELMRAVKNRLGIKK